MHFTCMALTALHWLLVFIAHGDHACTFWAVLCCRWHMHGILHGRIQCILHHPCARPWPCGKCRPHAIAIQGATRCCCFCPLLLPAAAARCCLLVLQTDCSNVTEDTNINMYRASRQTLTGIGRSAQGWTGAAQDRITGNSSGGIIMYDTWAACEASTIARRTVFCLHLLGRRFSRSE